MEIIKAEKGVHNNIALAGEFAAMSWLSRNGYDAALTLGNAKGVDILLSSGSAAKQYRVEVKTSSLKPLRDGLFGGPYYRWMLGSKAEKSSHPSLLFCFVTFSSDWPPKLFFATPQAVSGYVAWEHDTWLGIDKQRKDSDIRNLRIHLDDAENRDLFLKHESGLDLFSLPNRLK